MSRHKGDRVVVFTRFPRPLVEAITELGLADRNAWIIAAVTEKLEKDTVHGTP